VKETDMSLMSGPQVLRTLARPGSRFYVHTTPTTYDRDRQRFYQAARSVEFKGRTFGITALRAISGNVFDEETHLLLCIVRMT
jgi:hypothetical protein